MISARRAGVGEAGVGVVVAVALAGGEVVADGKGGDDGSCLGGSLDVQVDRVRPFNP